jgi:hypothetical protein
VGWNWDDAVSGKKMAKMNSISMNLVINLPVVPSNG